MSETQFCAIAQDLMPLQLDGVCSKQSEEFLRRHMAACENCRKTYSALIASVPAAAPKGDAQAPARAFHRFFHRRTVKSTLIALGCVLACLVIGYGIYIGLWGDKSHPLDLDLYEITMYRMENGLIAARTTYGGTERGYAGGEGMRGGTDENGRFISYIYRSSSLIPERLPEEQYCMPFVFFYLYEGTLYQANVDYDGQRFLVILEFATDEVRQGTQDHYRVIYRAGDELPLGDDPDYEQYLNSLFDGIVEMRRDERSRYDKMTVLPLDIGSPDGTEAIGGD